MLILLPPSETKRDGGDTAGRLDLDRLSHPELHPPRRSALDALAVLSGDLDAMGVALRLGPTQHSELLRNRAVASAPVMTALERYTGVLFDALDAPTLSPAGRAFAGETVAIHSALFGLLGADDLIPAYRLSHDSRLPGIRLKQLWSGAVAARLAEHAGLILDLRSEAYVAMGPVPPGRPNAYYLRVVAEAADGTKRALNHFNKKGKGALVRALAEAAIDHPDADALLAWAGSAGVRLARGGPGELELTVDQVVAKR